MSFALELLTVLLVMAIWEVARLRAQIRRWSRDPVTGCTLSGGIRWPSRVGVIYVDLDGLKSVNDAGGHAAGNEYLARAARAIGTVVRHTDVVRNGSAADEFIVLVRDATSQRHVEIVAARVRAALSAAGVRASLGAAYGAAREAVPRADKAMYKDKQARKAAAAA